MVVGSTITVDELLEEEGFDAIYLGVGAGLPPLRGRAPAKTSSGSTAPTST